MDNLDTAIRYSDLLLLYPNLLSETQSAILDDYFSFNLSISEIAENRHITRAAVEDAIKKGKKKLDYLEKEIGNLKLLERIYEMRANTSNVETIKCLEELERMLKHGI